VSRPGVRPAVTVRPARLDDAPALVSLLGELGYPTEGETLQRRLDALVASPAVALLVAERDGRVVGLASMHVMPLIERAPMGRLSAIVVAANERGAGIGHALVERVESEARARGCERLEVTSAERRADAHAFYRSLGFEPAPQRFIKSLAGNGE
jgi:N-acetylglutamate synthase-like GNAT family acetyltransferase